MSISKYNTLIDHPVQSYGTRRISNLNSNGRRQGRRGRGGRSGRGGRGSGRGRGRGGRTGRGRFSHGGRHNYGHYGPPMAPVYGNFTPEAKLYPPETFRNLSYDQKKAVNDLKAQQQWIDSTTPPPGFTIDMQMGFATPSNAIISAIRTATIGNTNSTVNHGIPPPIIHLPPPPSLIPPTPPSNNQTANAGASFGRSGTRARDSVSVSSVSINGQPYQGNIFDHNGNSLN